MADDIMKDIMNAEQGNPYNGSGVSSGGTQLSGMNDSFWTNGNTADLGTPMNLTHSLNMGMMRLYESDEEG